MSPYMREGIQISIPGTRSFRLSDSGVLLSEEDITGLSNEQIGSLVKFWMPAVAILQAMSWADRFDSNNFAEDFMENTKSVLIEALNHPLFSDYNFDIKAKIKRIEDVMNRKKGLVVKTPKTKRRNRGYVYLLKAPDGYFKIGKTVDPKNRNRTFKLKLPFQVQFLHLIICEDYSACESSLHDIFDSARIKGTEFFKLTYKAVDWICAIETDRQLNDLNLSESDIPDLLRSFDMEIPDEY